MLRRLKVGLAVASRVLRPSSLYSAHSSTDSELTDRDSIHSDPSHFISSDSGIYSPVKFGGAPYEVPRPLATHTPVEYCSRYNIYEEYGFDSLYVPVDFGTKVPTHSVASEDLVTSLSPPLSLSAVKNSPG